MIWTATQPMQRILVGVDLTERSSQMAEWARGFLDSTGEAVLVV